MATAVEEPVSAIAAGAADPFTTAEDEEVRSGGGGRKEEGLGVVQFSLVECARA